MTEGKIHYYLYQITNKINNKIYIGVHKTTDLANDNYMGSGTVLKRAIKKYGIENFEKVILEYFGSAEEMFLKEAEIVTPAFVQKDNNYNLCEGGKGWKTFDSLKANECRTWLLENDPEFRENYSKKLSEGIKEYRSLHQEECKTRQDLVHENNRKLQRGVCCDPVARHEAWLKSMSPEANAKRKATQIKIGFQQGEKNSQYGKMRITNGIENTSILKDQPIPEGWRKGSVGKYKKIK